MPKLDMQAIEQANRTGYPSPFDREVAGRWYRRLAPAGGLTQFGGHPETRCLLEPKTLAR